MINIIEAKNLIKSFNDRKVLNIEHLSFDAEKITVIAGPSGAGKSTLLSILNGLQKPDTGSVYFENEEFSMDKDFSLETRRKMAMVFQSPAMFNTTVYNNIAYGLKIRNISKGETEKQVAEIAEIVGLLEKLDQKALTLSGGEANRVSLARAMILKPKLIFMDEPTANLDPENVEIIENIILKAKKELKTAVILVTHNILQAERLADNLIRIENGEIV